MSLLSLLFPNSASTSFASSGVSISPTVQKLLDAQSAAATNIATSSQTGNQSSLSISVNARLAAAESADNKKDFAVLSQEVRANLDAQYAAAVTTRDHGAVTPKLNAMTGRALSAIILNTGATFAHSEVTAAKVELRERMRTEFVDAVGGKAGLSSLSAYNAQLITSYDAMSSEERQARGWTSRTRATAAAFVQKAGSAA